MSQSAKDRPDLSFVDTTDLLAELQDRSKRMVVCLVPLVRDPDDKYAWRMSYKAKTVESALGLCEIVKQILIDENLGDSESMLNQDDEDDEEG